MQEIIKRLKSIDNDDCLLSLVLFDNFEMESNDIENWPIVDVLLSFKLNSILTDKGKNF
jgi:hypothetical protein